VVIKIILFVIAPISLKIQESILSLCVMCDVICHVWCYVSCVMLCVMLCVMCCDVVGVMSQVMLFIFSHPRMCSTQRRVGWWNRESL